ncbi:unnamed protein product [Adineta ricciae]|uniref:Uncharacterized protein n=1 Tax=Adineta ricciae TaxID=249248 RepID=A0A815W0Z6_ADIRI|nr:unnamed protein product [Adineta ricciae]
MAPIPRKKCMPCELLRKVLKDHFETLQRCRDLKLKCGSHSIVCVEAAGFSCISNTNRVCCSACKLEISKWTSGKTPFAIHSHKSPTCSFVLSILPSDNIIDHETTSLLTTMSSLRSTSIDDTSFHALAPLLTEVDTLRHIRKRTFSHWPSSFSSSSYLSASQMIQAGFFYCNIGDRVMCIYCNIICHRWSGTDDEDPCEVHRKLSPDCAYVRLTSMNSAASSIVIINDHSTSNVATSSSDDRVYRFDVIVPTTAINPMYMEITQRYLSFSTWPSDNLPSVDDLVKSGFFYTGKTTIVTCFYCNGSVENWSANDDPLIEHVRRFPHCAYAKQMCDSETYQRVQYTKLRTEQKQTNSTMVTRDSSNKKEILGDDRSLSSDNGILMRRVAARLDLPISMRLVEKGFKLSIIKRCWEDQLQIKHDDFVNESDLVVACMILQKQIDCIAGKEENIIVPRIAMGKPQVPEHLEFGVVDQVIVRSTATDLSGADNDEDVEMIISSRQSRSAMFKTDSRHGRNPRISISDSSESHRIALPNCCVIAYEIRTPCYYHQDSQ